MFWRNKPFRNTLVSADFCRSQEKLEVLWQQTICQETLFYLAYTLTKFRDQSISQTAFITGDSFAPPRENSRTKNPGSSEKQQQPIIVIIFKFCFHDMIIVLHLLFYLVFVLLYLLSSISLSLVIPWARNVGKRPIVSFFFSYRDLWKHVLLTFYVLLVLLNFNFFSRLLF